MRRLVDVAISKDVSNVRLFGYEDMVMDTVEPNSIKGLRHIEENRAS
jgi:hypothetical protein